MKHLLAILSVLSTVSSSAAQQVNPRFYPTLSLRNFWCIPDGIQRVPIPDSSGERYFLVPVYIYNEVDTAYNPNVGGQHLEAITSIQFQFLYYAGMMSLDTNIAHGSPIVMKGSHPYDTALTKAFSYTFSDREEPGNAILHRIRISGTSSQPLPLAMSKDSGCWKNNGTLLWLRFKVIGTSNITNDISLDSSLFNGHEGDSLLNPHDSVSLDYTRGNFGGGIGANSQELKGHGSVLLTPQPAFGFRPAKFISTPDSIRFFYTSDLEYDPTTGASGLYKDLVFGDAVIGTVLDDIQLVSGQFWLVLGLGGPTGGTQVIHLPALSHQSTGTVEAVLFFVVPNPPSLPPALYIDTVTFTSDGALHSPAYLIFKFWRYDCPFEPYGMGHGTGIRLHLSNSCRRDHDNVITFGTGHEASEGIDSLFRENVLTGNALATIDTCFAYFKPLDPNVDARFRDPSFAGITRDIRSDTADSTLTYRVAFIPGDTDCYPIRIAVDPSDFPDSAAIFLTFSLSDTAERFDLRTAAMDSNGMRYLTISDSSIKQFYIEYTRKPKTIVNSVTTTPVTASISVSPNPSTDIITIYGISTRINAMSVLNLLGEDVLDLPNPKGTSVSLDLSNLPSGTYFLRMVTDSDIVTRKIAKE